MTFFIKFLKLDLVLDNSCNVILLGGGVTRDLLRTETCLPSKPFSREKVYNSQ